VEPKPAPKPDEPDDDDPDQTFGGGARGAKGGSVGGIIGGTAGGTLGGTIGGTLGGTIGGTIGAPEPEIQSLPAQMANSRRISGAEPELPAVLRRTSLVYVVAAKICVSKTGSIDSVSITQSSDSLLERNVLAAVKGWRYRPFMSNNKAVPFCTSLRFEYKSE
jgi:protein TonB